MCGSVGLVYTPEAAKRFKLINRRVKARMDVGMSAAEAYGQTFCELESEDRARWQEAAMADIRENGT